MQYGIPSTYQGQLPQAHHLHGMQGGHSVIMSAPSAQRQNKNDIFANLLNPLGSSLHFGQPFGGDNTK